MNCDFNFVRSGVPRYQSGLFERFGVRHAFFTRLGGVSVGVFESLNFAVGIGEQKDDEAHVMENYAVAAAVFGLDKGDVCRSYQTHTSVVERAERGRGVTLPPYDHGVDGIYTDEKGVLLSVRTADCVPVLICDKNRTICAAVHAGWRGTVGGIMKNALDSPGFKNIPRDEILVAIGPCIGQCCYEVGGELLDIFLAADPGFGSFFAPSGGKYMLDLTGANAYTALKCGVPEENISAAGVCTKCLPELFFSHRRSGHARGTMGAFICL